MSIFLNMESLVQVNPDDIYVFKGKRLRLVNELRRLGISDELVLQAINRVPRHLFFDPHTAVSALLEHAYANKALPIGSGQTISHPFTVAFQSQHLNVKPGMQVLEIGTGCGYQTAVLLELGVKVYSIERQKKLFENTRNLLPLLGYSKAKLFYGDGYKGLPAFAPYDKILVTASAPQLPKLLLKQLKIGGQLLIPIGPSDQEQTMYSFIRTSEVDVKGKTLGKFNFVPMLMDKATD